MNPNQLHLQLLELENQFSNRSKCATVLGVMGNKQIRDQCANDQTTLQWYSKEFLKSFNLLIKLSDNNQQQFYGFEKVSFGSVFLYVKEITKKWKKIRLIFFPIKTYLLTTIKQMQEAYKQMYLQQILLSKFLSPSLSSGLKIFVFSNMGSGRENLMLKLNQFQIQAHTHQLKQFVQKQFNIEKAVKQNISYVLSTSIVKQKMKFREGQQAGSYQILIIPSQSSQVYLFDQRQQLVSYNQPQFGDGENMIKTENVQKIFFYKRFLALEDQLLQFYGRNRANPQFIKFQEVYKNISKTLADDIMMVHEGIVKAPLYKIKSLIFQKHGLEFKPNEQNKEIRQLKQLKSFENINKHYGLDQWRERNNGKKQALKYQIENFSCDYLSKFIEPFALYQQFEKQDQSFIDALVLEHIELIGDQMRKQKELVANSPKKVEQLLHEQNYFQFCLIIVKFIGKLKKFNRFKSYLQNFEEVFYEYLVDVLVDAYCNLCFVTNCNFGYLTNSSVRIGQLKCSASENRLILMKVPQIFNIQQQIKDKRDLFKKQKILRITSNLLEKNKPTQKDKSFDIKTIRGKYGLAIILYQIAILRDQSLDINRQGDNSSEQQALRILFGLFEFIFANEQNKNQFAKEINFTEIELLSKMSGVLRFLHRLDLSIQVQKRLNLISNVKRYYDRWMMQFRRGDPEIIKIITTAIKYFEQKQEVEIVQGYYDMLMLNSQTQEDKEKYYKQKLTSRQAMNDPNKLKKYIDNLNNKSKLDLDQAIKSKIKELYNKN